MGRGPTMPDHRRRLAARCGRPERASTASSGDRLVARGRRARRRGPGPPRAASRPCGPASMSGWIAVRARRCCGPGVNQRLIVIRTPPSFSRRPQTWTVFLPKVGSPTSVARPRSWSAAATISEADADPPLMSTTTRQVGVGGDAVAGGRVLADVVAGRLLGEDQAVVDELAGDLLRRLDVAARVVAQVEHDLVGALVEELLRGPRRTARWPARRSRSGRCSRCGRRSAGSRPPGVTISARVMRDVERLAAVALDGERDVGARLAADLA